MGGATVIVKGKTRAEVLVLAEAAKESGFKLGLGVRSRAGPTRVDGTWRIALWLHTFHYKGELPQG